MDNSGTITVRFVPGAGIDQRVAMVVGSMRHFYHPDRLGKVIAMVDNSGVVTDQYLYTPFGVQEPFAASGNPFRYTGRWPAPSKWSSRFVRPRQFPHSSGQVISTS